MEMEMLDLQTVEETLNTIADFLYPCMLLANGHATDFITQGYWDRYIPTCIQEELLSLTREELNSLPCRLVADTLIQTDTTPRTKYLDHGALKHAQVKTDSDKCTCNCECNMKCNHQHATDNGSKLQFSSLVELCSTATSCTIEGLALAISPDVLLEKFDVPNNEVFIGTFMSEKKSHEVEVMSKVCSSIARRSKCQLIVDFGSGKGYLGKHLSLQYKLAVLGVDAVDTNTRSAEQRSAVLDKQWQGLTRNAQLKIDGKKLSKSEKKKYKCSDKQATDSDNKSYSETVNAVSDVGCDKNKKMNDVVSKLIDSKDDVCSKIRLNEEDIKSDNNDKFAQKLDMEVNASYVPCTSFIDHNTNFRELANRNFPHLFSPDCNHQDSPMDYISSGQLSDASNTSRLGSNHFLGNDGSEVISDCFNERRNSGKSVKCENSCMESENLSCQCNKMTLNEGTTSNSAGPYCDECTNLENHRTDLNTLKTMLIGLHTCGNLASTSVEMFARNDELNVLCNVGCCYHLLDEKYNTDGTFETNGHNGDNQPGFPLSTCLNKKKFSIGNTARNLASQAVYRVPEFEQLQGERFYPRALLEVIIQDVGRETVGKPKGLRGLEKKSKSTKDYLRQACDKLKISEKVSDEMLDDYMDKYMSEKHRLAAFFQLKTVLAPCIESLIVLDRIAFLLEKENIKQVYLVKMFDPVISPRCYAIIALKD